MINQYALRHEPKSNYCFAYSNETIELRFKATKDDLKKVNVVYGDKYKWEEYKKTETMEKAFSDGKFDYFIIRVKAPFKRLSYYFELYEKGIISKKYYYTEWGFVETIDESDKDLLQKYMMHYPYINNTDLHQVPEWVKGAVFYQIFPERFYNGDDNLSPENTVEWDAQPTRENFFGGDLVGVKEKLDYLADLGVNAIYLNPIFEATTNHKYDTIDYKKIDPHFGDEQTLIELVQKAHSLGIKVVLDCVFNHSGYKFDKFLDVKENGKDSEYRDWFYINDYPVNEEKLNYETFGFEPKMPKLNTENEEVIDYLIDVATYWIETADIDGWRLDVADEIDHKFWRVFREEVKKVKDDLFIVGEIWHNSKNWLRGDQFDSIMNYPVQTACYEYFAKDKIDRDEFKYKINRTYFDYTSQVNEVMMNLLDSHDTPRFITEANGNKDKLILAFVFELFYPGCTSLYYGTEIGLEGGKDPDCRKTMQWDKRTWDMELYQIFYKLIHISNEHEVFNTGDFRWLDYDDFIAYKRFNDKEEIWVLINKSDKAKTIKVDKNKSTQSLITHAEVSKVKVQKNSFEIIKIEK